MTPSPLGRYSEAAALVTALAVVATWLVVQVGILPTPANPGALDAAATFALGLLLGQRSSTNGAGKMAAAAHDRVDLLETRLGIATHAPAAASGAAGDGR